MNEGILLSIGIDWSKVAKLSAMEDIRRDQPDLAAQLDRLDSLFREAARDFVEEVKNQGGGGILSLALGLLPNQGNSYSPSKMYPTKDPHTQIFPYNFNGEVYQVVYTKDWRQEGKNL